MMTRRNVLRAGAIIAVAPLVLQIPSDGFLPIAVKWDALTKNRIIFLRYLSPTRHYFAGFLTTRGQMQRVGWRETEREVALSLRPYLEKQIAEGSGFNLCEDKADGWRQFVALPDAPRELVPL